MTDAAGRTKADRQSPWLGAAQFGERQSQDGVVEEAVDIAQVAFVAEKNQAAPSSLRRAICPFRSSCPEATEPTIHLPEAALDKWLGDN